MAQSTAPAGLDFNALVKEYYTPLYRFGYSLAGNEDDAADLTQQTFFIWAEKGNSLRDVSKVKSWLFTTLYREFLRLKRKAAPKVDLEPEVFDGELYSVNPDVVRHLDAGQALESLEEVDEIYRQPLSLFYIEDMAYKEIAETLGLPIGTVMSRLSRGKAQLKAILTGKKAKSTQ